MSSLDKKIAQGFGDQPAETVLRGGKVFDLITGEFFDGDVAICDGIIVGTNDSYDAKKVIDVGGKILVPGFIDTHLHIESSMVTPFEFDRCVAPLGVTTAICDPHEIANVIGEEGVHYFQQASECTLMSIKVQVPSCVPSTEMETSGARLDPHDLMNLMDHSNTFGLAEMMNYPGVIARDSSVLSKIELFRGKHIDGHAPLLSGKQLNAYITAGISTDHEATTVEEAKEKLRKGLRLIIREGSVSKDLVNLAEILNEKTSPFICLCTDDRNPLDIAEYGHIDYMIRKLIRLGVPVLAVYRSASLSAAEAFGLKDRGLISPGKRADIVVVDSLEECRASLVLIGGKVINNDEFSKRKIIEPKVTNSVLISKIFPESFIKKYSTERTNIIGIKENKIITDHIVENVKIINGDKHPDLSTDTVRVAVIERHGKNGNLATGFVRGFGLKSGAIASTVAHDHHNIVIVGIEYSDMAVAANRLAEIGGGFVVVNNQKIVDELALPFAGLMSLNSFENVKEKLISLRSAARGLGVELTEPFLQLAFIALPVIPDLKITDIGMIDVKNFTIIDDF